MQAAEFPSVELAARCEHELAALVTHYTRFEATDPDPWGGDRVPPPLVAFGERHGVTWPPDKTSRFLIKGLFRDDEVQVLRVDRMVFFSAAGFELGGETLRAILLRLGARAAVGEGKCHLAIRNDDPDARVEELAEFLRDEDFEDQFTVCDGAGAPGAWFTLTVVGPAHRTRLAFEDSGVEDWAFVALLPQLCHEDPTLFR
jgi:hypothetical protein